MQEGDTEDIDKQADAMEDTELDLTEDKREVKERSKSPKDEVC